MVINFELALLLQGRFSTNIAGKETLVKFKIYSNCEVSCEFECMGTAYVFNLEKWKKTSADVVNPWNSFLKFVQLFYERYGGNNPKFGSFVVVCSSTDDLSIKMEASKEQIVNLLVYAMIDVFLCAEDIIITYKRSLLDYCIFHLERGICNTYEEYIDLVACHCLVHSNFIAPGITYIPVEFLKIEREYSIQQMEKVNTAVSNAVDRATVNADVEREADDDK